MTSPASFQPPPGGIGVSFVRGMDRYSSRPAAVKRAGLDARFAVVQQTAVEGCDDMYFEAPLWRALAHFVHSRADERGAQVTMDDRRRLPLERFLQVWDKVPAEDQEPPPVLTAQLGGRPILCMVTEYWTHVGGPALYHDSYTYAFYSDKDVGDDVLAALAKAPCRARWTIASQIQLANGAPRPSLAQRLRAWITGATDGA